MKLLRMGTRTNRHSRINRASHHMARTPASLLPFRRVKRVDVGAAEGATYAGALAAGTVVVTVSVVPALAGTQRARRALSTALSLRLGQRVDVVELDLHWVRGSQHVRAAATLSSLTTSPDAGWADGPRTQSVTSYGRGFPLRFLLSLMCTLHPALNPTGVANWPHPHMALLRPGAAPAHCRHWEASHGRSWGPWTGGLTTSRPSRRGVAVIDASGGASEGDKHQAKACAFLCCREASFVSSRCGGLCV